MQFNISELITYNLLQVQPGSSNAQIRIYKVDQLFPAGMLVVTAYMQRNCVHFTRVLSSQNVIYKSSYHSNAFFTILNILEI